jgi:hypothetical protein
VVRADELDRRDDQQREPEAGQRGERRGHPAGDDEDEHQHRRAEPGRELRVHAGHRPEPDRREHRAANGRPPQEADRRRDRERPQREAHELRQVVLGERQHEHRRGDRRGDQQRLPRLGPALRDHRLQLRPAGDRDRRGDGGEREGHLVGPVAGDGRDDGDQVLEAGAEVGRQHGVGAERPLEGAGAGRVDQRVVDQPLREDRARPPVRDPGRDRGREAERQDREQQQHARGAAERERQQLAPRRGERAPQRPAAAPPHGEREQDHDHDADQDGCGGPREEEAEHEREHDDERRAGGRCRGGQPAPLRVERGGHGDTGDAAEPEARQVDQEDGEHASTRRAASRIVAVPGAPSYSVRADGRTRNHQRAPAR